MISVTDELGDQHMLADSISPYSEADDADSEPLDSIPALINADHLQKTVSLLNTWYLRNDWTQNQQ